MSRRVGRDTVISRGDIRWFRFDRPDKRRPVLVLGRPDSIASWSQIPVIPLSTQIRSLPWEVFLPPTDGLPSACVLKPEWIRAVERAAIGPLITTLKLSAASGRDHQAHYCEQRQLTPPTPTHRGAGAAGYRLLRAGLTGNNCSGR